MKQFKARASEAGKLMVQPRSKSETLSETTKTYLEDWLKEKIYGYRKEIKSKYLDKGIMMEDEAISKAIEWLDLPFVLKNEQSFEDEFFTGTPDIVTDTEVLDIKCSWDAFSFPLFEDEIPTKDYFYQLQVYMHLTSRKVARLVYVLTNTPESITWETPHEYSSLDKRYRIKTFYVAYDAAVIEALKDKVMEAQSYIYSLSKYL